MKLRFYPLLLALCIVSCKPNDPNNNPVPGSDLNIVKLRSAGKQLPGDVDYSASNCIPDGSAQTLRSVRYVDPLPIYYMDYYAKVDWNKLEKDSAERYAPANPIPVANEFNSMLYTNATPISEIASHRGACSGFMCFSPQNELLFCRNYDGDTEPLVIIFNHVVGPGEYKSVMMTSLTTGQASCGNSTEYNDRSFLSGTEDVSVLLRQPTAIMDGMNSAGLCLAAYQLPNFSEIPNDDEGKPTVTQRPSCTDMKRGKKQITSATLHQRILRTCKTVDDVKALFDTFDLTAISPNINVHWYVADADNNNLTIEIWKKEDGRDTIYTFTPAERNAYTNAPSAMIPYEYRSIENYYVNPEATRTFPSDYWQYRYTNKSRVHNMMSHYSPVMSEKEALQCLQYGTYGIEMFEEVTDWSCVYNPKKRTVIFNMRNDMSMVYSIDLNEDLK